MTIDEFKPLAKALRDMYPTQNFLATAESIYLWANILEDLPYEAVAKAVYGYMAEEHFQPTVSDIRKRAVAQMSFPVPEWDEGWSEVQKYIRRYGYMRETEALEAMTDLTRKTVERLGWQHLCMADIDQEMSDRRQFRDIYEREKKNYEINLSLPDKLKPPSLQSDSMKALEKK